MSKGKRIIIGAIAVALGFAVVIISAYSLVRPRLPYVTAPASAVLGVLERPVRVVSYNILHNHRGVDAIVREVENLSPDFVLLQEVESRDVEPEASDHRPVWVELCARDGEGPRP